MKYPLNYIPIYHPSAIANIREIQKLIKKKFNGDKKKVLDIGSGMCYFLIESFEKFKGFNGFGIDLNRNSIRFVKDILKENKKTLNLILADVNNAPFKKGTFDIIVCNHVLEHVKQPKKISDEIFHILKENGDVYAWTPSKKHNSIPKLSDFLNIDLEPPDHIVSGFFIEELRKIFSSSGFKIIEKKYKSQVFGKIIHDFVGLIGEVRGMEVRETTTKKPIFKYGIGSEIIFLFRRTLAQFLSLFYNLDIIFDGFEGRLVFIKAVKPIKKY